MKNYIYDGSFDGLLTSIHTAFYNRENPYDILAKDKMEENFLRKNIYIQTNAEKARKVYEALENKISRESLRRVFYCYLSELPKHGILILKYLRLGFKLGPNIDLNLANDIVREVDNISKKVSRERHRFLGLIRFKEIENHILYSTIEPDHNIIGLVAPHFANRMKNEHWVIHDVKRGIGVFYNKKEWVIKEIEIKNPLILREDEEDYQDLWKTYFNAIAIENKTNLKLQKSNMPMKYWKHLVEKEIL